MVRLSETQLTIATGSAGQHRPSRTPRGERPARAHTNRVQLGAGA
jgi:hypothetical protein